MNRPAEYAWQRLGGSMPWACGRPMVSSRAGPRRAHAVAVVTALLVWCLLATAPRQLVAHRPPPQPFQVAAVQFNPTLGQLSENVERLADLFEQAARQGAKIVVAPEMATTGYLYADRQDIAQVVETIPGPTTRRFSQIAADYDCYLVWGMPERDADTQLFYNASAIVGPEGYLGKYRKTHLWESEAHWSAWGDQGIPVFATRFGNVALLICQDANYIETFRLAALGGADLICFSTNSSGQTLGHLQARAVQNGVYVIGANRSNSEVDRYSERPFQMRGCSAVWSPEGKKLAEAAIEGEEIVYAPVDPARYTTRNRRLAERCPASYLPLARHVAPWNSRTTREPRLIESVAVQYRPLIGDIGANRLLVAWLLAAHVRRTPATATPAPSPPAATPAARLIVLPELSLVGNAPAAQMQQLAEPRDRGPTFRWVAALARQYEAFVVCGLPERDGTEYYNAAIVVDPEGKWIGHSRKVHLHAHDRTWASAGERWTVVRSAQLGRLGVLVGNDSYMAEAGSAMAVHRADVVAVAANWHGEIAGRGRIAINSAINPHARRNAMVLWDDMAWSQQFFVVVANTAGDENHAGGLSGVYSTDPIYGIMSRAFATGKGNEVVVGRFQTLNGLAPEHWIDQHHYIGSRRPDALYQPLLTPSNPAAVPSPALTPAQAAGAPN